MITAGIDSGSQNTKAVIVKDGKIIGKAKGLTEFDALQVAEKVYEEALADAGISKDEVDSVAACGQGRSLIDFADGDVNDVSAAARGAYRAVPTTDLVIDMGAESSRVIKLDENGVVQSYEVNDKCASGAGTFFESMARVLEIDINDLGPYSLKGDKKLPMNAQCVVFAESEVITLIHNREKVENIAYSINIGISNRITALVRRVGTTDNMTFVGGPALNQGLVQCIKDELKKDVTVPENPDYISAFGAAEYAAELIEKETA